MSAAVFLDRDGVLIEEKNYLHRPVDVVVLPEAGNALKRLQDAGFALFIVTNQSGVGRGYFSLADVDLVHECLAREFARHGVRFTQIYVAPEAPDQPSRGRKPSPQFLFDAQAGYGIDLAQSHMVGDKSVDLQCGWNAGVKTCWLVRTGYGAATEEDLPADHPPLMVVDNLKEMADRILAAYPYAAH